MAFTNKGGPINKTKLEGADEASSLTISIYQSSQTSGKFSEEGSWSQ